MADDPRKLVFVDSYQPPLDAGGYEVTVRQTVTGSRDGTSFAESFANLRRLYVRGERFALDPGEVVAVFPPAGSRGDYADVLPHVVFARRTLPWERDPGLAPTPDAGTPPTSDTDSPPTWLAVLLLTEDEARQAPPQTRQVSDLAAAALPAGALSYATAGELTLEPGESGTDPCQTIDVPAGLFARIAPGREDLRWLAHARTVPAAAKATADGGPTLGCSVVVGNRLPLPSAGADTNYVCHLVSLEGLAPYLPGRDVPASATVVQLVSLTSWSFTSASTRRTFGSYFQDSAFARPLRAAYPDDGSDAAKALGLGYVALPHQTRFGDSTVSWYRGPLLPYADENANVPPPRDGVVIKAADDVLTYDPGTGMLDVSYAAAWEFGRLLAVASRSFSVSLAAWKGGAKLKTVQAVQDAAVSARFASLSAQGRTAQAGTGISAERLLATLAPRTSVPLTAPDPGRGPAARLIPPRALLQRLAQLGPEELTAIHADTEVPDDLVSWLRDLTALAPVPFCYLVPGTSMLPPESLRFFVVDPSWVNALIEGATSIGRSNAFDLAHNYVLAGKLYNAVTPPAQASGFLLHSAVVDGWPGLEVTAFDDAGALVGAPPATAAIKNPAAAGDTTLTVQPGDTASFPDPDLPDGSKFLWLSITPAPEAAVCTQVTGGTLTLERGAAGTRARDLLTGDLLECDSGRSSFLLAADVAAAGPRVAITLPDGAPLPGVPFDVTLRPSAELVKCTAVDDGSSSFTVVRAQQHTSAHDLLEGDQVTLASPRLRLDRLGPSLLLFLTTGKVAEVRISEPGEGLHFGFRDDQKALRKALRGRDGLPLANGLTVALGDKLNDLRRLDIVALAGAIVQTGGDAVKNDGHFTAAEFAFQLVEGVESVRFERVNK